MEINSIQLHCSRIAAHQLALDGLHSKNEPVFHVLAFRYEVSKFMSSKNSQFCLDILNTLDEITHLSNGWYRLNRPFELEYEHQRLSVGLTNNKMHSDFHNAYNSTSNERSSLLNWLGPPFLEGPNSGKIISVLDEKNETPEMLELNLAEWFLPENMKSYKESWVRGEELFQRAEKKILIGRIEKNYSKEYLQLNEDGALSYLDTELAHDLIALQWYYVGNNYFMEKMKGHSGCDYDITFKMLVPTAVKKLITILAKSIKTEQPHFQYTLSQSSLKLFVKLCKNRISWNPHEKQ